MLKVPQPFKEKSTLSSVEMDLGTDGGGVRALSIFQSAVVNKRFFGAVAVPFLSHHDVDSVFRWKGGNRDSRSDI